MEDAVKEGKLRTIGVSSLEKEDLDNLMQNSSTKPAVNQILAIAILQGTLFFALGIKPKRVRVRTENNTLHRGR